jgi:hypothetical protein
MKRVVNSLTESAAATYGPEGIRVNAIAPGTTLIEMMRAWDKQFHGVIDQLNTHAPLRRAAEPNEIAEAAAWLAQRPFLLCDRSDPPRRRRHERVKAACRSTRRLRRTSRPRQRSISDGGLRLLATRVVAKSSPADDGAAEDDEGLVDVVADLPADAQATD